MDDTWESATEKQARTFASFDYLRQILDACPYVVIVLNEARQIVFFNRALYALTAPLGEKGLVGLRFGEALNCVWAVENAECGISEACQTCGAFLAVGDALSGLYGTRECRFTQTSGERTEWLDLSISVSPAFVAGDRFLVCSVRDISHEKRKAVLERIFFHDLMNSITGVELLARMLESTVHGDATVIAQQISSCAGQLVEEVQSQQLLIAAEREELAVQSVLVTTALFLRASVERYRRHPVAEGRFLEVTDDSQDVAVSIDDSILRRVVDNMLKNALEACSPGATVQVACYAAGGDVEFHVHNPGVMPESVQSQVFQRSFSTKGAGRGLGTYSMRLLSERYLKGSVLFRSNADEGTVFIARYPKSGSRPDLVQLSGPQADPIAK